MPNIHKLLAQDNAGFKRYTGIHKATFHEMLDAMQQHEAQKTKSGRPSALSLEEQILLALTYWREYRTLYHISMDFGIHESSASRIIRKVEDILIRVALNCLKSFLVELMTILIGQSSLSMRLKPQLSVQKKPKRLLQR
ncbi:transposase family protein [Psychrobacter sp. GP33]|uniref:helix-turn-helix domain-containing protein n=1 Tax=Psychrobacter sp. GP33 TaxID=2758709 RepID=UPI0015FD273B|nr:transposase family protein [Psychrobacter sp. GP33]